MSNDERVSFAERGRQLVDNFQDIKYFSITVQKTNVQNHIRNDSNKLYNYMINLLLLEEMAKYDDVRFVPDPRSIKVESGNSLHDYLQTQLWFDRGVTTQLATCPSDSSCSRNVQFADMLSGLVQSHFEDNKSAPWAIMGPRIISKKLFFS